MPKRCTRGTKLVYINPRIPRGSWVNSYTVLSCAVRADIISVRSCSTDEHTKNDASFFVSHLALFAAGMFKGRLGSWSSKRGKKLLSTVLKFGKFMAMIVENR